MSAASALWAHALLLGAAWYTPHPSPLGGVIAVGITAALGWSAAAWVRSIRAQLGAVTAVNARASPTELQLTVGRRRWEKPLRGLKVEQEGPELVFVHGWQRVRVPCARSEARDELVRQLWHAAKRAAPLEQASVPEELERMLKRVPEEP